MCTLYTFDSGIEKQMLGQIAVDSRCNDDGYSVVLCRGVDVVFRGQFTELRDFLRVFLALEYDRAFVHLRASTTSTQGIPGCHMFNDPSHRYIFAHNGILTAGNEAGYPVDSQWLGEFLEHDQVPDCDAWDEGFANFLVIDCYRGKFAGYAAHRTGNLYTDGKGNYSTTRPGHGWTMAEYGWTQYGTELIEVIPDEETAAKIKERKQSYISKYTGLYRGWSLSDDWDDQDRWTYRKNAQGQWEQKKLTDDTSCPIVDMDSPPFDEQDGIECESFVCEACNVEFPLDQEVPSTVLRLCKGCHSQFGSEVEAWEKSYGETLLNEEGEIRD